MSIEKPILEKLEETKESIGDLDQAIEKSLEVGDTNFFETENLNENTVGVEESLETPMMNMSDIVEKFLTCPDCGGNLINSPQGPLFCPTCALKNVRTKMGTLSKAMDRIKGLCGVYFKMLQTGEAYPNKNPDDLVCMLPNCLVGLDLSVEKERILNKTSTLSAQQREYLKYFFDAQQLCQLLLDRKKEEEEKKGSSESEAEFSPMEEGESLPIVEKQNTASVEEVVVPEDSIVIEENINDIESQPLSF